MKPQSGSRSISSSIRKARFFVDAPIPSAIRNRDSSSKALVMICNPIGNPDREKPQGMETAGIPLRLADMVKISERYMARGSFFSPSLNLILTGTDDSILKGKPVSSTTSLGRYMKYFPSDLLDMLPSPSLTIVKTLDF